MRRAGWSLVYECGWSRRLQLDDTGREGVEELRPLTSLGIVVVEEHVCVARMHEVHRVPIEYGNCLFVHGSAHTQQLYLKPDVAGFGRPEDWPGRQKAERIDLLPYFLGEAEERAVCDRLGER